MSDIGPGDVVVCVDAAPDAIDPLANLLSEGRHYRVAVVGTRPDGVAACAFRSLAVRGHPKKGYAYALRRFRKIRPADPEFIALLKRVPVDA